MSFIKLNRLTIALAFLSPALYFLIRRKYRKMAPLRTQLKNLKAFLLMIQYSEGTLGPDAYRKLYGGALFSDFSRHPNFPQRRYGITSTAAGAYQILYKTWTGLQTSLRLPDFSPKSQNKAAIELIRRRGALEDVMAGRLAQAIYKCRKEWASLPGAGYNQKEQKATALLSIYKTAGGTAIAA